LYTDGIVEARGPGGQEFGRERLERVLLNAADAQPAEFLDSLFRTISGTAQEDDLTAVLAQFD
jgi:serine phosphatase RsbU (regulator of sigma subunit)